MGEGKGAEKSRIEYEGARYHVLNRGDYRQDLFVQHRAGEKFVKISNYSA